MSFNPLVSIFLMLIPTLIKAVIIGMVIWAGYFFIKEKAKSTLTNSDLTNNPTTYVKIFGVNIKKRSINKFFLLLGTLPLLIYPMVLAANAMMLASLFMSASGLGTILSLIFVFFTSLYLPIYLICLVFHIKHRDGNIRVTSILLIYVVLMLFVIR